MRKIKRLTIKELENLKKALHKIEFEASLKLIQDMTKILNNSSELRKQIIISEKEIEKFKLKNKQLEHKNKIYNEALRVRDKIIIPSLKQKIKFAKNVKDEVKK